MKTQETNQMIAFLQDERNGAAVYYALAEAEKDTRIAEVYKRMAVVEERHAQAWAKKLEAAGILVPPVQLTWRTRSLTWLAKRFGVGLVLPSLVGFEKANRNQYSQHAESGMAADENMHARVLNAITQSNRGGMSGGLVAQMEGRHRASGGNALRAAVLGANDGLVSNLSLVMGVAGAELSNTTILITGMAGLLAGAFSMALGEWLSVQSSRELYQHQINIEKAEIASAPEEEAQELALIYQARGMDVEQAQRLANQILEDPVNALETLAREELNVDPAELGGSAWEAALTSLFLFAGGAIIPVIPFTFLNGLPAVAVSAVFSTIGLFIIGAGITLFTGRSVLFSGGRQVLFGLGAAAITYLIGRLIGVNLGG